MAIDLSFLEKENNPEILREMTRIMSHEIERLNLLVEESRRAKEKSEQLGLDLQAKYALLRQDYFGRGREKFSNKNSDRPRDTKEQEVLFHSRSLVPEPKTEDTARLPQERRRYEMTSDALNEVLREREPTIEKDFKAEWKEMASFVEESREVTIIERRFIEIIHERQKYKAVVMLPAGEEKEIIIAAPGPERLLPGCTYGIEMAVAVVAD